jgi:predicted small integral membrane protein
MLITLQQMPLSTVLSQRLALLSKMTIWTHLVLRTRARVSLDPLQAPRQARRAIKVVSLYLKLGWWGSTDNKLVSYHIPSVGSLTDTAAAHSTACDTVEINKGKPSYLLFANPSATAAISTTANYTSLFLSLLCWPHPPCALVGTLS